jgi:hypothetical protein
MRTKPAGGNDEGERIVDEGERVAAYRFLVVFAAISTVRSLVDMLAPDAARIRSPASRSTRRAALVSSRSSRDEAPVNWCWRSSILRYPMLTPLMLAIIVVEQLLRLLAE